MILFLTSITIWKNLTENFVLSLHPSRWMNTSVLGLHPCGTSIVCTGFPSIGIQSYLSGLSPSRTHKAYFPLHTFAHPPLVSIDFRKLKIWQWSGFQYHEVNMKLWKTGPWVQNFKRTSKCACVRLLVLLKFWTHGPVFHNFILTSWYWKPRTCIHTHTHPPTHTCTHARAHTHTHTHTQSMLIL